VGEFVDVTLSRVPEGLVVPEPLVLLFQWVEDNGFVKRGEDGELHGSLSHWPGPGTDLSLRAAPPDENKDRIAGWFGGPWWPLRDGTPVLWFFCTTGGDGSQAALWFAPDGHTRIVHLGSGSGSLLTCVLGETAVDFLRLVAIGYEEICWSEDWHEPPQEKPNHAVINEPYRHWVTTTFNTTIPATALELVPAPAEMGDTDTQDVWCQWVNAATSLDTSPDLHGRCGNAQHE